MPIQTNQKKYRTYYNNYRKGYKNKSIISNKNRTFKNANKIQYQRTTTAEHKRESIPVMTTVARDRKRQTETKTHQQNIEERTGIVRNSKNIIQVWSSINQFRSTNHVKVKHDNIPQQKVIKSSDDSTKYNRMYSLQGILVHLVLNTIIS